MSSFKSIISGLLLCGLLVDPLVATFSWFYYQKTIVKREVNRLIHSGLDRDDLVLLKFSKEESQTKLRWEHSKEFEYNRQMYDVVETMTLGDAVYYWCWLDHKETKLNKRLDEITAQTLGRDHKFKEKNERLISFFKSLYCTVSFNWNGSTPQSFYKKFSLFLDLYISITIQPPTPPPQLS